jgi:hypothetical protein
MGVNITRQFPKGDLSPQGTYGWGSLDKALVINRRFYTYYSRNLCVCPYA